MEGQPGRGPGAARIYDYWIGGQDWHDADRDTAEALLDPERGGYPGLRDMARENRRFVIAAVQRLAGLNGIGQFLDLGCGLPARPAVHETARGAIPGARVAYVDSDPLVVSHMAANLHGVPGTAVLEADLTDPASVLDDKRVTDLIDFSEPAGIILGTSLTCTDLDTAQAAVAGYAAALAERSAVVISCSSFTDPGLAARVRAMLAPACAWRNYSAGDVESLLAGLHMIRGRVCDIRRWPMLPSPGDGERPGRVLGGVGFVG